MKRLLPLVFFFVFCATVRAQGPATGFPPYSSIESGVADATNRYNLNTSISIPIVSSQGRGTTMQFSVAYNSALWKISGGAWVSVTDLSANPTWGWNKAAVAGMLTETSTSTHCEIFPQKIVYYYNLISNVRYFDADGTGHYFPTVSYDDNPCTGDREGTDSGYANDGSGYFMTGGADVYTPSGTYIIPGIEIMDTNGNQITSTVVNGSEIDWKDSAGHNALKVVSSSGNVQYQTLDPTGVYRTTTLALTSYNIKTNFGCSGITEYTGTASLPSSITLPNGLSYSITYEGTPSHSGYYTGRISQITLPNGGYIQYQYNSPNDGINCTDGSVMNLTRTQNDGTTSSAWTFSRAQNGSNWVTTITAPLLPYDTAANQSVYTFNSSGQETAAKFYQGSSTAGTLLRTINTAWASNGSPARKTTILDDNSQSEVETTYDSNGNLQVMKEHDYGSGAPGSILRTTNYTYLTSSAYTNLNIINRVITKTIADSTGTVQYREDTAYDGTTISPCPTGAAQHEDVGHGCSFTARGNPTSVTTYTNAAAPSGGVTKNSYYDVFGNLVKADINCCQSKSWAYSSTTQYSYPDSETCGASGGLTTSHTYNGYTGQVASDTDPNNQVTQYGYDMMRRLTSTSYPDSSQVTTAFTDTQHYYTVTHPIQGTTVWKQIYDMDGLGRVVKTPITDGSGTTQATFQQVYDPTGGHYQIADAFITSPQSWLSTQHDALGRVTKAILTDGSQALYSYSGPNATMTDPSGKQEKFQYNGLGQLKSVYEPDITNNNSLTVQTTYAYTVLNQEATITQGSQTRTFNYDGMGRLTSEITPEAGTVSYQYNSFDLMSQRTDARGVITTYSYDSLNRPYQTIYNVGTTGVAPTPTVTNAYGTNASQNNNGRLITMTDGTGSESYSYDVMGRVTQLQKIISSITYPISYQYNQAGKVTSITYPSGKVIQPSYDSMGRLLSVANGSTNLVSGLTYDVNFRLTGFSYANGVAATLGHSSPRTQLSSLTYKKGTQTIFGLTYGYTQSGGNNGQISGITDAVDSGRNVTYTYDALGRLSAASTIGSTNYPAWGLSFVYDRYGNRTAQNVTGGTAPGNQVTVSASTNHITTTGYSYDANGNITNDGANTLTYDAENRMLTSTGSGSGSYSYDGNGLRLSKTSSGATTVYIFDGTDVLAEYASGSQPSNPAREYVYMSGRLISRIEASATYYYHPDHLSTRLITDSSGNTATQQGHYPFGEQWYVSGTSPKWKFTSYERDTESGNDYAKFRYSASRLGRFATSDPVRSVRPSNPQTFNRYSYVANDPINRTDRSGRIPDYCGAPDITDGEGYDEVDSLVFDPFVNFYYDEICPLIFSSFLPPPPEADPCDQDISWGKNITTRYKHCGVDTGPHAGSAYLYVGHTGIQPLSDEPPTGNAVGYGGVKLISGQQAIPFFINVYYTLPRYPPGKLGIIFNFQWKCRGNSKSAFLNVAFTCLGTS